MSRRELIEDLAKKTQELVEESKKSPANPKINTLIHDLRKLFAALSIAALLTPAGQALTESKPIPRVPARPLTSLELLLQDENEITESNLKKLAEELQTSWGTDMNLLPLVYAGKIDQILGSNPDMASGMIGVNQKPEPHYELKFHNQVMEIIEEIRKHNKQCIEDDQLDQLWIPIGLTSSDYEVEVVSRMIENLLKLPEVAKKMEEGVESREFKIIRLQLINDASRLNFASQLIAIIISEASQEMVIKNYVGHKGSTRITETIELTKGWSYNGLNVLSKLILFNNQDIKRIDEAGKTKDEEAYQLIDAIINGSDPKYDSIRLCQLTKEELSAIILANNDLSNDFIHNILSTRKNNPLMIISDYYTGLQKVSTYNGSVAVDDIQVQGIEYDEKLFANPAIFVLGEKDGIELATFEQMVNSFIEAQSKSDGSEKSKQQLEKMKKTIVNKVKSFNGSEKCASLIDITANKFKWSTKLSDAQDAVLVKYKRSIQKSVDRFWGRTLMVTDQMTMTATSGRK